MRASGSQDIDTDRQGRVTWKRWMVFDHVIRLKGKVNLTNMKEVNQRTWIDLVTWSCDSSLMKLWKKTWQSICVSTLWYFLKINKNWIICEDLTYWHTLQITTGMSVNIMIFYFEGQRVQLIFICFSFKVKPHEIAWWGVSSRKNSYESSFQLFTNHWRRVGDKVICHFYV